MEKQPMASPMEFTCQRAIFDLLKARYILGNCFFTISLIEFDKRSDSLKFEHCTGLSDVSSAHFVLVLLSSLLTWRR